MNQKPGFLQKAEKALAGKGFYMVLLLCLVILGASGYYLYRTVNNLTPDQTAENVSGGANVVVTVPPVEEPVLENEADLEVTAPLEEPDNTAEEVLQPVAEPVAEPVEEPVEETAAPVEEPVSQPVEDIPAAETVPSLGWPVQGEIVAAFSASELTYNEAMGDWRTHNGMDISAGLGAEVLASAEGVVESIANDPVTGTTLTLTHAGGLATVYGNLDADTLNVAEGDTVAAGQLLACVGSSASGESGTGSFLHFAVTADGQNVDPADYLS